MPKRVTYAERRAAGLRRVEVWLQPEDWAKLEEIQGDGTQAQAVVAAIREAWARKREQGH